MDTFAAVTPTAVYGWVYTSWYNDSTHKWSITIEGAEVGYTIWEYLYWGAANPAIHNNFYYNLREPASLYTYYVVNGYRYERGTYSAGYYAIRRGTWSIVSYTW